MQCEILHETEGNYHGNGIETKVHLSMSWRRISTPKKGQGCSFFRFQWSCAFIIASLRSNNKP